MIEKKCEYCGKVMLLPPARKSKRFCSPHCAANSGMRNRVDMDFPWKKFRDGLWQCRYRPDGEIGCTNRQCGNCGWNPEVAEARTEAIRQKLVTEAAESAAEAT